MIFDRLCSWWCRLMHPAPMWPCSATYQCPRCQRRFPVPWSVK